LAVLNLDHVVFDMMMGVTRDNVSRHDKAYQAIVDLTVWSVYWFIPLALAYLLIAAIRVKSNREGQKPN
jgi:hypothetical protein